MNNYDLKKWFKENSATLETRYLLSSDVRKQSGFSGSLYKWTKCRKVIADCIDKDGTFLDIGCANGYLLKCVMKWKTEDGIKIIPYGLDISEKLLELAEKNLEEYDKNFFHGNVHDWKPPIKFDYVRTELVYVPKDYRKKLIERLLKEFVKKSGKLLLCEYRSTRDDISKPWIDVYIEKSGFSVHEIKSGYFKGNELSRVVSICH